MFRSKMNFSKILIFMLSNRKKRDKRCHTIFFLKDLIISNKTLECTYLPLCLCFVKLFAMLKLISLIFAFVNISFTSFIVNTTFNVLVLF